MATEPDGNYPIDLRGLELEVENPDPLFVAAIMARIDALPLGRASRVGPLWGVWSMARELGVAALAIVMLAVALREWNLRGRSEPATLAEALGVPTEFMAPSTIGAGR